MHQSLGLISFLFLGIVGVILEILANQDLPIDLPEVVKRVKIPRILWLGMTRGENKGPFLFGELAEGTHQNDDFTILSLLHAPPARADVVEHDRVGGEVKRDVIAERSARREWNLARASFIDELVVADIDEVRGVLAGISTVQAIL